MVTVYYNETIVNFFICICVTRSEVPNWIIWFALRAPEVPEQNKINLIVEQNKYFNYYENKNVFKKK